MAPTSSSPPPKISKAWILGWGKEPFKQAPPPPPPSPPRSKPSPMTSPGAMLEWVASDGRKGKLTGAPKISLTRGPYLARLTAANVANVPAAPSEKKMKAKTKSTVAQADKPAPPGTPVPAAPAKKLNATPAASDLMGGLWGAFAGAPVANTPVNQEPAKTAPAPVAVPATVSVAALPATNIPAAAAAAVADTDGFTAEQDAELIRRKTENETWAEIAAALGKEKYEVTKRFGKVKPADWKANPVEKGKKGKNKGNHEKKNEENKAEESGGALPVTTYAQQNPNGGHKPNNDMPGPGNVDLFMAGFGGDRWAGGRDAVNAANAHQQQQVWNTANWPSQHQRASVNWNVQWASNSKKAASNAGTDRKDRSVSNQKDNNGRDGDERRGNNGWGSNNGIRGGNGGNNGGSGNGGGKDLASVVDGFNDVYPDDTFSMDDLALISRILKRDHNQVWFRLSCAFRDKTGRHIDEEVFRQKLLGDNAGKGGVRDV